MQYSAALRTYECIFKTWTLLFYIDADFPLLSFSLCECVLAMQVFALCHSHAVLTNFFFHAFIFVLRFYYYKIPLRFDIDEGKNPNTFNHVPNNDNVIEVNRCIIVCDAQHFRTMPMHQSAFWGGSNVRNEKLV